MPHSALASGLRFASRVAALVFGLALIGVLPGQAQTFTVLHAFNFSDGSVPLAGVTIAANGNLYGVTSNGGTYQGGVAYRLRLIGSEWAFTKLYEFGKPGDGLEPCASLTFGPDGALYGTTTAGGTGGGTVFNLKPQATVCKTTRCPWLESTIWPFQFPGGAPPAYGALIFDQQGNAYGTTQYGGNSDKGAVYKLSRQGQLWTETRLYSFGSSPNDGYYPLHNVVLDRTGNLYGTTSQGGDNGGGTVFQLVPSGGGWTENIIASLPAGSQPQPGLIIDIAGNLYGATTGQGNQSVAQVFELSPSGKSWQLKTLYRFPSVAGFTLGPYGNLVMAPDGSLYGATYSLGLYGYGNIFKLTSSGPNWTYTDLYDFTGENDGANPVGDLSMDANGNVYGTTQGEGNGLGVVWELAH
jgi:uncharacterized repeat protein (TIGR03803 family)